MESTYRKPTRPQYPNTVVYALHAGDLAFRYVGTTHNARMRLTEHRSRARTGHAAPVYQWMREVGPENVSCVILDPIFPTDDAEQIEASWIRRLLDLNFELTNEEGRDGVPRSKTERGMANLKRRNSRPGNARECVIDGVMYPSALEASRALGISYSTIRRLIASSR